MISLVRKTDRAAWALAEAFLPMAAVDSAVGRLPGDFEPFYRAFRGMAASEQFKQWGTLVCFPSTAEDVSAICANTP